MFKAMRAWKYSLKTWCRGMLYEGQNPEIFAYLKIQVMTRIVIKTLTINKVLETIKAGQCLQIEAMPKNKVELEKTAPEEIRHLVKVGNQVNVPLTGMEIKARGQWKPRQYLKQSRLTKILSSNARWELLLALSIWLISFPTRRSKIWLKRTDFKSGGRW